MAVYPASITCTCCKKAIGVSSVDTFGGISSEEGFWFLCCFLWMFEMVEVDSATGWKCFCAILMKYWVHLTTADGSLIDRQQLKSWCGVHHLGHAKQRMVSKQLKHVLNQMTNKKHRTLYPPRFPACELKKNLWLDVHQRRILYLSHWWYST